MAAAVKTIIVALDPVGSAHSSLRQALRLASSLMARLVAISVTPVYEGAMSRLSINDANRQLAEPFEQCLKEAAELAASCSMPLTTVHRVGIPADEIIKVAEEERAVFLILGSPQRNYLERVFLGRTTAQIIGLSPCDVLLIPDQTEIAFSRILVGIDGSRYSMEAGQRALDLAMSYGSQVHALTVVDVPVDRSLLYGVLDEARRRGYCALKTLAGQGEKLGVPVITAIREDAPYKSIVSYVAEHDIQLTVLGSFGRTALSRILLGSVVERVAALAPCPTLVVKRLAGNGTRTIA